MSKPKSRRSRASPSGQARRKASGSKPAFAKITAAEPPPLIEGKVRCPSCRNVVTPTSTGRLRRHRDLFGSDCLNIANGEDVTLAEIPPVIIPPPPAPSSGRRTKNDPKPPSRLDVGSTCQSCGKWLPGERRLCGRCQILGR